MSPSTVEMRLDSLLEGRPGLTPHDGGHLAECAAVCLSETRDGIEHEYRVQHTQNTTFHLVSFRCTEQMKRSKKDLQDATELGACGLAVLTMEACEHLTVYEKSAKDGGGFDYYLIPQNVIINDGNLNFFSPATARLEVSGILNGDENDMRARLNEKIARLKRRPHPLPAYVLIVEFSHPCARMEKV